MTGRARTAVAAAFHRELAALRLNRFLLVHVGLAGLAGLLPLFTPGHAAEAAPWFVVQVVLYCQSLTALLIGLSAAHGERDEFALLFAQPAPRWAWLAGKALALGTVLVPSAALLALPTLASGGVQPAVVAVAGAAAGVGLAMASVGLALGFWVRDPVRGLLAALGTWFVLLFGTDLALLAVVGLPGVQAQPAAWVVPLMLNPLDALRVTVLFSLEEAAPPAASAGRVVAWWLAHGPAWLAGVLAAWTASGWGLALAGARRAQDL